MQNNLQVLIHTRRINVSFEPSHDTVNGRKQFGHKSYAFGFGIKYVVLFVQMYLNNIVLFVYDHQDNIDVDQELMD